MEKDVDWTRTICFNVDDLYDPRMPEECTCGHQTHRQLYDKVRPKRVHVVRYNASDAAEEARRFESVVRSEGGLDVLCQGIGTSGHLAINEPLDTDFSDAAWVKVVKLTEQSRIQLQGDPNFSALERIPAYGITMTIPLLTSAPNIFTMVPFWSKRPILEKLFALSEPTGALPASILLRVPGFLYLDRQSAPHGLATAIRRD